MAGGLLSRKMFSLSPDRVTASIEKRGVDKKVEGVVEDAAGNKEPILRTSEETYVLAQSQKIPKYHEAFPLYLKLKPKGGPGYVQVASVDIQSVGEWNEALETVVDLKESPDLRTVTDLVNGLGSVVQNNLTKPPEEQDLTAVLTKYDEVRNAVNAVYPTVLDRRTLNALQTLQGHLDFEQRVFFENKASSTSAAPMANAYFAALTDVEKRFYRLNENYRPEVYRIMSRLCDSSAAIVRRNTSTPIGSGVVVGDNLVLTAKHNIEEKAAKTFGESEYTVWFDFEERIFSRSPEPIEYDAEEAYRSDTLDFVLLRIQPKSTAQGSAMARPIVPFCSSRPVRWTPIFLFGYPQGSKNMVHDSGWVLFPHKLLSNSERGLIESEIADDFFDPAGPGSFDDKVSMARNKAKQFMTLNYGPFEKENSEGYLFTKDDAQCLGVEADLFEGDSGAPAILRENGKLIGILTRGPKDIPGQSAVTAGRKVPIAARAGAKYHELLLPATLIIEDLRSNHFDLSKIQILP